MRVAFPSAGLRSYRTVALTCLCITGVVSCDGQHATATRTDSSGARPAATTRAASVKGPGTPMVDHTLLDAGWGIAYATVKLPPDWAFNGGVVHGEAGCVAMGDSPMWSAESPDKSYGIVVLPMLKTGYTSVPAVLQQLQQAHCPTLRSTSAVEYLTQLVLPHLHSPGSMHIVSVGPEPQLASLAEQFRQANMQMERASNNQFSRMHTTVETARILLQYKEGGKTLNEVASALFACTDTQMTMPPTGYAEMLDCTAPIAIIGHGPDDGTPFTNAYVDAHSKDPAFYTISPSAVWQQRFNQKMEQARQQQNQQFQQTLSQSQQNMRNQQAQFDAGQARYHAQQQSNDQYNAAWKANQQKQDQSHEAFRQYLSGTNVYTDNQTGKQYEMSNQYNDTYINQNGQVGLQTNSATSPGVDWTLLQPKH